MASVYMHVTRIFSDNILVANSDRVVYFALFS